MTEAEQITKASKSNLALAFLALDPERRRDISVFYAFCRLVDDVADDPGIPIPARRTGLARWRLALDAPTPDEPPLARHVRSLIAKYALPTAHFSEIIAGCEMDLEETRFPTWEALKAYCHRVASVVGLVSIEIFGYRSPACREYALQLGLALQLTNILRDVGQDYSNGQRIYLPLEEITRFGYSIEELARGEHNEAFLALMQFQAARARALYRGAEAALPASDRRSMIAAEIMRAVYHTLLGRMHRDNFQVFSLRYQIPRPQKAWIVARTSLICLCA